MKPGDAQKPADASARFRQPDGRYSCYMTDVPCKEGAFTEAHVDAILAAWGADPSPSLLAWYASAQPGDRFVGRS